MLLTPTLSLADLPTSSNRGSCFRGVALEGGLKAECEINISSVFKNKYFVVVFFITSGNRTNLTSL